MYLDIVDFTTIISLVSVATERAVEVLKPILPEPNPKYKTFVYSSLALGVSTTVIYVNEISTHLLSGSPVIQTLVIGLACTAGSGFWNDTLKLLQNLKVKLPS